jgi:hypothetical protein
VEEIIIRDLMRGGSRKWVEIEEGEADSFCLPFLLRGEGIRGHARRRQRGMGRDSATSPLSENRGASESCLTRGNPSAIARNVILFYPSCDLESSEQEILFFLFYPPVRLAGGWWLMAGGWFVLREEYCWLVLAGCWWLVCSERKVLLSGG